MNKKKRKKPGKKLRIIALVFAFALGLFFLGRTIFFRDGKIAGEQSQKDNLNLEELKNKLGPDADFTVDRNTGRVTFISSKKNKIPLPFGQLFSVEPAVSAKYFMQEYGKYLGLGKPAKELMHISQKSDEKKMNHLMYNQRYQGIPVFGAQAIVHLNEDSTVRSVSAKFLPDIASETKPKISRRRAIREAEKYWEDWGNSGKPQVLRTKLYIFNKGLVENKKSETDFLVFLVELFGREKGGHEYFFINAEDGSLAYHLEGTRSLNRRIFDGNSGSYNLARPEGQGATGVADIDTAYDVFLGAHNYFLNKFARNGANNQGGLGDGFYSAYANTDAYVRIDNLPEMAGICPNAYFDYYSAKFCTGLAVTDIIGHEYMHGVTYHTVLGAYGQPWGFDYTGESGAVEEAYSNFFGEAIENSIKGNLDWQLGEDSQVPGYESVSFSFSDPGSIDVGLGPYPGKKSDAGFYCGTEDYGGVHQNSSVVAHGAYLAAVGGSYNGYVISGIGLDATERIFYRALTFYLTTTSNLVDLYNSLNAACSDLYGAGSGACLEMQKALQAVELEKTSPCEGGEQAQITTNVSTLAYSAKKNAKRNISFTVANIGISKKKQATVRVGGRKVKVLRARSSGDSTVVVTQIKYRKWVRGSYGVTVSYKKKVGKSWQTGSFSEGSLLSII